MDYDVLIIGAGAAGLSAAIYTCRKKLKTTVVSIDTGGQTNLTSNIENYPGTEPMHGHELMKRFKTNAQALGCEFINGKATLVEKTQEGFKTTLSHGEKILSKTVITCFGKVPRKLSISGEEKFAGRGVSQCSSLQPEECTNKTVVVIGGGNSAVETVIKLSKYCKKIHLLHRRDTLTADETSIAKLKEIKNIEYHLNTTPLEITGDKKAETIKIKNNTEKELPVDEILIEIGYMNDPGPVQHLVDINEKKEIIINERCETKTKGLYAAGDCTTIPFKQTITSAGEGAKAGLEAHRYLTGGKGVTIDWTH
ncbi:FAD-dependent oxidoreductase [Candidatus Woesearchaeota archaeon]|nr:FAD-dependent oxidoreductase [Candidatus Woesearchaeota archaeon]